MIIDTHCHYDMMPSPEQYIKEAEANGNILIGMTNLPSHFSLGIEHIRRYKYIRLALGYHPQLAKYNDPELKLFEKYLDQTSYIGEIGLDFSREFIDSKDTQIDSLRKILSILQGKNKIVSVHSRKAESTLLQLLKEYNIRNVIWHWYSGPLQLISEIEALGHYFSINEAMTKSINGKKIIKLISRERILTESDAPFNKTNNISNALLNTGLDASIVQENCFRLLSSIR